MANISSSNGLEKRPKLRFPGFDEPWHSKPFGDLIHEYSIRTQTEDEDTLLSAAIEGMFLNTELFGHQRGASNKGYKKIKYGTMVLSTQNLHLGNANVNLRFKHGMVSPAYKTYDITGCSIELLAHWIKSDAAKHFFYNATTVGASMCRRNVEWETLYEQLLFLPSVNEQDKIASFLSILAQRIDAQQKYVKALKKYKRGLLSDLFGEKSTQRWTTKSYSFSEVAQRRSEKYDPSSGIEYPCVELENIEQETGKILATVPSTAQSSIKNMAMSGDTLFGKLRPYLRKYAFAQKTMACSSEIWALIPSDVILPKFLFYLVQTEQFLRVANISSGTKMPRAEWSNIEKAEFFIPDLSVQRKVVSLFERLDQKINFANSVLFCLNRLNASLLQQLFI